MAYISFQPTDYFNTLLFVGTQTADSAFTGLGFSPDIVWVKGRNYSDSPGWWDTVRGAGYGMNPTNTAAQSSFYPNGLTSFDADGFTMGNENSTNYSGKLMASWSWKAGTTSGIATDGSTTITPSTYSFNQAAGISILKYTGNNTSGAKVAHGLGVAPSMIIVKQSSATRNWGMYNIGTNAGSSPEDYIFEFDQTGGKIDNVGYWNDTVPDSVNFTIGNHAVTNGDNGGTYMAYCFAAKKGFSKFGSYTGNGNIDGPFIYTGFRPAMIIRKKDGTDDWMQVDNKRLGYNPNNAYLFPNATNAESDVTRIDLCANGFKLRTTDAGDNGDGTNYIYMAFAEFPFVSSNSKPTTAR